MPKYVNKRHNTKYFEIIPQPKEKKDDKDERVHDN